MNDTTTAQVHDSDDALIAGIEAAIQAGLMKRFVAATQRQIEYATALGKDVAALNLSEEHAAALQSIRDQWSDALYDRKAMSAIIDALITLKREAVNAVTTLEQIDALPIDVDSAEAEAEVEESLEGMHRFGGVFFKVQRAVHGSGRLYAKALVEDPYASSGWSFEYAPGALRNLSAATRLSIEEAKEWGLTYGVCCVCGRTLTNEESIALGIGPVCGGRV